MSVKWSPHRASISAPAVPLFMCLSRQFKDWLMCTGLVMCPLGCSLPILWWMLPGVHYCVSHKSSHTMPVPSRTSTFLKAKLPCLQFFSPFPSRPLTSPSEYSLYSWVCLHSHLRPLLPPHKRSKRCTTLSFVRWDGFSSPLFSSPTPRG